MKFELIQDYKNLKKGQTFDSFNGMVCGVDDIRFDNKEYFKTSISRKEIILNWFNDNFDLIKRAIESQKYPYSSIQGKKGGWISDEMMKVFKKIKQEKIYSEKTSNIDIWIKISKYFPTKFGHVFYSTENAHQLFNQNLHKK